MRGVIQVKLNACSLFCDNRDVSKCQTAISYMGSKTLQMVKLPYRTWEARQDPLKCQTALSQIGSDELAAPLAVKPVHHSEI